MVGEGGKVVLGGCMRKGDYGFGFHGNRKFG